MDAGIGLGSLVLLANIVLLVYRSVIVETHRRRQGRLFFRVVWPGATFAWQGASFQ